MMYKRALLIGLAIILLFSAASAQRAEVTVGLNEAFFDALLDSAFQNFNPPEFSMVENKDPSCNESIKVLREINGVRTAVRFREGKIFVPLAFSGNYAPPFVGCVAFSGWAETNIDLEFDQAGQRLIGRAHVLNVNLSGTGGVGGKVIAKLLQRSIDQKLNPIEIIRLDKLSFGVPVQNGGNLRMRATSIRPEIDSGMLNIPVTYEFLKG